MAVEAMIPLSRSSSQIPVARHPAMAAVLIIAELNPMALRTQRHGVGVIHRAAIRQMQSRVSVAGIMTGHTRQLTMAVVQTSMKLVQIGRRAVRRIGRPRGMTRHTGDGHRPTLMIPQLGGCSHRWLYRMDQHRMLWRPLCDRSRLRPRRFVSGLLVCRRHCGGRSFLNWPCGRAPRRCTAPYRCQAQNRSGQDEHHTSGSTAHAAAGLHAGWGPNRHRYLLSAFSEKRFHGISGATHSPLTGIHRNDLGASRRQRPASAQLRAQSSESASELTDCPNIAHARQANRIPHQVSRAIRSRRAILTHSAPPQRAA